MLGLLPYRESVGIRRAILHREVRLLHDVLERTPMAGRYWLDGGLLLGWARSGDALAHDTDDVDFAFRADDYAKFVSAVPDLEQAGFVLIQVLRDNQGEVVALNFKKYGIQFDFLKVVVEDGRFLYRAVFPAPLQVTFERPQLPLEEVEFFGRRWMKPADHDQALTALYGDWKTPRLDWRTDRDSPSIVAREPWQWTSTLGRHDGNFDEYLEPTQGAGEASSRTSTRPSAGGP
jgi:hypothetical protein